MPAGKGCMFALRRGIWAVNDRGAELFHRRGRGCECRRGKSIHSLQKSIAPTCHLSWPSPGEVQDGRDLYCFADESRNSARAQPEEGA